MKDTYIFESLMRIDDDMWKIEYSLDDTLLSFEFTQDYIPNPEEIQELIEWHMQEMFLDNLDIASDDNS